MKEKSVKLIVLASWLFWLGWSNIGASALVITRKQTAKSAPPNASQIVPSREYSQGNPSDEEQYLLELVNRARANPFEECNLILDSIDRHIQQALVAYNIDTDVLLNTFSAYTRKPPLALNSSLSSSALAHSEDMAANDFQGHVSSDGSTLTDRFTRAGYQYRLGGENVFSYAYSSFYAQAAFLVDWGVDDLGHRNNLLDLSEHTNFREVGISIVSENNSATAVGPLVITQDFGMSDPQTLFITGVVYRDSNHNNFYDPGEGLGSVTVMPDHGEYYAVTSSSGGYVIPVALNSGKYVLTIARDDLPELTSSTVIADENVKVDFPLGNSAYATVTGTVISEQSAQPVPGVKITLDPVGRVYTTDDSGNFIFSDLPASTYKITAQLEGCEFQPNNFNVVLTAGQESRLRLTATGDAVATPSPKSSDPIVNLTGGGCAPMSAGLLIVMTLAFGSLRERRR